MESYGGSTILLTKPALPFWRGIEEGKNPTDYERAYELEEYINPIQIEKFQGILFDQGPMPTTWIKIPGGVIFIRWLTADSDQIVVEHLPLLNGANFSLENFTFTVESSPIILIDSADNEDNLLGETLEVDMNIGTYSIETAEYYPEDEIRLFLHRFLKIEN